MKNLLCFSVALLSCISVAVGKRHQELIFLTRKNLLVIFTLLIFYPGNLLSQQIIKFKSGNVYKVNIVGQTPDTVKYHMSSEPLVIRIALMEQIDSITTDPFWLPSKKN